MILKFPKKFDLEFAILISSLLTETLQVLYGNSEIIFNRTK
jgi:hypothetical protein